SSFGIQISRAGEFPSAPPIQRASGTGSLPQPKADFQKPQPTHKKYRPNPNRKTPRPVSTPRYTPSLRSPRPEATKADTNPSQPTSAKMWPTKNTATAGQPPP